MSDYIHIVCLDAPSPPNYGGAIDMYYKIQSLAETGKKIILHYFNYNPARNTAGIEKCCDTIFTYKRKNLFRSLPLLQPYIIQSRINQQLIDRLNEDNHSILLEGLHCSGVISFLKNKERVVIRMHNEEASYYYHLAKNENNFLKKQYFLQEAKLLKQYQQKLDKNILLACLSESDMEAFQKNYTFDKMHFIPCFTPWQSVTIKEGKSDYCLYHGNMAVSENEKAACWLIENVFGKINVPLVVAGNKISKKADGAIKDLFPHFLHQ